MASRNDLKNLVNNYILTGGGRTIAANLRNLLNSIIDSDYNKTDDVIGAGSVTSVNSQTPDGSGNVTLTKGNIGLGNVDNTADVDKPVSTAQAAADTTVLNSAKSYADGLVVGLWDDRGSYDASGNAYPSSGGSGSDGAILKGDIWTISVAGTLPTGQVVEVGDVVRALVNSPGNTQSNWAIAQNNIGYVAENATNKTDTMSGNTGSSSRYLSAKGVYDWVISLGYQVQLTATNFGSFINSLTAKTTPVDADSISLVDSEASNVQKKVTLLNFKAFLKTYFDTLYTGRVMTTLGDFIFGGVSGAATRLPGNTSTAKQYVSSIGNGSSALAPTLRDFNTDVINGLEPNTLGTIITENWPNVSNWTKVGAAGTTFTPSSNTLLVASTQASLTLTDYLRQTAYGLTNLNQWDVSIPLTLPSSLSATTFGVAFGLQSQAAAVGLRYSLQVAFCCDTTNAGKIAFFFQNSTTGAVYSTASLPITANDTTTITIRRVVNKYIATWTITTVGSANRGQSISFEINMGTSNVQSYFNPNAGNFSIYALGGSFTLGQFSINSDVIKSPDYLFVGDSITFGYCLDNVENRYVKQIQNLFQGTYLTYAQGGNQIEDSNTNEILAICGSNTTIVSVIGTNNVGAGNSTGVFLTKYQTYNTAVTANGNTNIVCALIPRNSFDVTPYNAVLQSNFFSNFFGGTYYSLWAGTGTGMASAVDCGDGTHPNVLGNRYMASALATRLALKVRTFNNKPDATTVYYQSSGNVSIGNPSYNTGYRLDVQSSTTAGATQIRFGAQSLDNGGYLTANAVSTAWMSTGVAYDGTNWIGKSTGYVIWGGTAGSFQVYQGTTSAGATVSPALVFSISSGLAAFVGGGTLSASVRVGSSGGTDGVFLQASNVNNNYISFNSQLVAGAWTYRSTGGIIMGISAAGTFSLYADSGTANTTYTPTERFRITSTGAYFGGAVNPTAAVHIRAGTTASAPLRIVGGVAPTTPNSFDIWSETTNNRLMFRQGANNVEIIGASAVNTVSPTAQNRTLTVVFNGTTYYITAKTTND